MSQKKKVLFVATVVKTHIMEFHLPYLKMFKEMGWETAVAARNDYVNKSDCIIPYCDLYYDIPFERNPISICNIKSYKMLKKIIDDEEYDIVHCHTPVGGVVGRLASKQARNSGVTRVFYTAHGFHFYKGAPIINWIIYYPIEKIMSRYTDILITINREDYNRALNFGGCRVEYVPGVGIDLRKFTPYENNEDRHRIENEFSIDSSDYIILSVGELIPRKNHEVIIKAISILKKNNISHIKYLICGDGILKEHLKKVATEYDVAENVIFCGYRNDIDKICQISNVFAFMSIQEGLPVALMEAMACGIPIVCSKIRGNIDLIDEKETGVFAKNTPDDVAKKIEQFYVDKDLARKCSKNSQKKILNYTIESVLGKMRDIYNENKN